MGGVHMKRSEVGAVVKQRVSPARTERQRDQGRSSRLRRGLGAVGSCARAAGGAVRQGSRSAVVGARGPDGTRHWSRDRQLRACARAGAAAGTAGGAGRASAAGPALTGDAGARLRAGG